jgi:hypothetical protein
MRPERRGKATTHRVAASPSRAHVQAAIDAASPGDTVSVPAGSATWATNLVITSGIELVGAVDETGAPLVLITSAYDGRAQNVETTGAYLIAYNPSSPSLNQPFRLSGFSIDGNAICKPVGIFNETTSPQIYPQTQIRVDHCHLFNPDEASGRWSYVLLIKGTIYGAVDHNTISGRKDVIKCYGNNNEAWSQLEFAYGSAAQLYIEDNDIVCDSYPAIEGGVGGRYCARYNRITVGDTSTGENIQVFDAHGNTAASNAGQMGLEVYGNETYAPNAPNGGSHVDHRGGRGLFYENVIYGPVLYDTYVYCREEENDSTQPPATTDGGMSQHVTDSYYWSNKHGASVGAATDIATAKYVISSTVDYGGGTGLVPQWDRDCFRHVTSGFNGSAGVGVGLRSARPSSGLTVGVGYWATDESVLYRATSATTWAVHYTPYTYPHPLVS